MKAATRMRLALIFVVVVVVTLNTSGATLTSTKDSVVEKPAIVDSATANTDGGRLLRRGENGEDGIDEERGFALGDILKKLSPIEAVKKLKHTAKVKKALRDNGNYHTWLQRQAKDIGM
ncbi:unnamed protein product [Phytophthora fragariaefolia]|uniref:RxLR effector protein n=1 Tax=Phytophthora fragariaefolia TaxID=1490495 RepID=A0A9W7CZE2_9STRA|nr:unnamed protein product [Phytophthora fragariaefolia]